MTWAPRRRHTTKEEPMDVIHAKCAGLDVHQKTIVACARVMTEKTVQHQLQTFGTTTDDLLALGDWLARHEVTHVAMESTGVYWKPVWYALEGQFQLLLANPMHVRNAPGRARRAGRGPARARHPAPRLGAPAPSHPTPRPAGGGARPGGALRRRPHALPGRCRAPDHHPRHRHARRLGPGRRTRGRYEPL